MVMSGPDLTLHLADTGFTYTFVLMPTYCKPLPAVILNCQNVQLPLDFYTITQGNLACTNGEKRNQIRLFILGLISINLSLG